MKQRRISLCLLFALLISLLTVPAQAASRVVSPPDVEHGTYYVDEASCLSADTRSAINRRNIALTNACGAQLAVVTLSYLPSGLDSQQYAYRVLNDWGVGDKKQNNGIVFVLVTEEKRCWIATGAGIDDDLTPERLEKILETHCYDSLDSGRYDEAVADTVDALFSWYEGYYHMDLANFSDTQVEGGSGFGGGSAVAGVVGGIFQNITAIIALLIVLAIVVVGVIGAMFRPGMMFCNPFWCGGPCGPGGFWGPRGPRGPYGPGGFGGYGGFGGGMGHSGGAGRGAFGGGSFGGGRGRSGGAGRR